MPYTLCPIYYGNETETPSLTQARADMTESGVVLLTEATEPSPRAKRITLA